jgi:hypothetical protein
MSLRGYVKKTRPAPWTTTPAEACRRAKAEGERQALKAVRRYFKRKGYKRRIAPVSKSRRSVLAEYRREARLFVAAAVALGETCPVVDGVPELRDGFKYGWPVSNKLVEVHHVRGRSGALLMDKTWWMAISKQGHRWVHQHPRQAAERGWLAGMGEWNRQEKSS